MKKIVLALTLGLFATSSAFAWGEREQGILSGVAGLWVFQQLQRASQPVVVYQQTPPVVVNQPPVIVTQPPIYQQTPPVVVAPRPQQFCEYTVVTDQFGVQRSVPFCYFR